MSEPQAKKPRTEGMIEETQNTKTLYSLGLFKFEWFLIELGTNLISVSDEDLITFLCLNKTIYQDTMPIFRKHFLNFELQKQFVQSIQEKNWKQVEKLFNLHSTSLNPNVFLDDFETEHLAAFLRRDAKLAEFIPKSIDFPNQTGKISLATISIREPNQFSNGENFTKQLLQHKRFNFEKLNRGRWRKGFIDIDNDTEIMAWSALKGHFDIFSSVVAAKLNDSRFIFPLEPLLWLICIVFDKIEFTKKMLDKEWSPVYSPYECFDSERLLEFNLIDICVKLDREDHFETIFKFSQNDQKPGSTWPNHYFATWFAVAGNTQRFKVPREKANSVLKFLKVWNSVLRDLRKEKYLYALAYLRFAYFTAQHLVVKQCLSETKFQPLDLINTFQEFVFQPHRDLLFSDCDVSESVESLLNALPDDCFLPSWNQVVRVNCFEDRSLKLEVLVKNKHYAKSNEHATNLLVDYFSMVQDNAEVVKIMIPHLNLAPLFDPNNKRYAFFGFKVMKLENLKFLSEHGVALSSEQERKKICEGLQSHPKHLEIINQLPLKN